MVAWGSKAVGAVFGFSNVAVYFLLSIILFSNCNAIVSPPPCFVVAAGKPSSSIGGTAKSPLDQLPSYMICHYGFWIFR